MVILNDVFTIPFALYTFAEKALFSRQIISSVTYQSSQKDKEEDVLLQYHF